jgi:hypothetical protein
MHFEARNQEQVNDLERPVWLGNYGGPLPRRVGKHFGMVYRQRLTIPKPD